MIAPVLTLKWYISNTFKQHLCISPSPYMQQYKT